MIIIAGALKFARVPRDYIALHLIHVFALCIIVLHASSKSRSTFVGVMLKRFAQQGIRYLLRDKSRIV